MVQSVASSEDRPVFDSAVTPHVFLDTDVFRTHQLDFQSPNIRGLVRLAARGRYVYCWRRRRTARSWTS
jgi:hypothetical protein